MDRTEKCLANCEPPCGRPVYARGVCFVHYTRAWMSGEGFEHGDDDLTVPRMLPAMTRGRPKSPAGRTCSAKCEPPCMNEPIAHGLCMGHYRRMKRGMDVDTPLRFRSRKEGV